MSGPLAHRRHGTRFGPMRTWWARTRAVGRAHPVTCLLAVQVWVVYAAYQLWIVVRGPIGYWNDSVAYVAVSHGPLLSAQLLAGARPPLVPLLWKATGTNLSFSVVQTLVAIGAWTYLAATAALLVRPGWHRLVAGTAVLVFASCWEVTEWNWNILSDSLAVSATAVICAAAISLVGRYTLTRALVLVAACLVFVLDRDQAIWAIVPVGVVLAGWGAVRLVRHRGDRSGPGRVLLVLGLSLCAVAAVAELGAATSHRNVVNMVDVFDVRVFPFPDRVHWFAVHGMPQGHEIDAAAAAAAATARAPGAAKVVGLPLDAAAFRPLHHWFATSAQERYVEFLVTHPAYFWTAPFGRPELTFNNAGGNLAGYGSLVDPNPHYPANHALPLLPRIFFPSQGVVSVLAVCGAVVFVLRRGRARYLGVLGALVATGLWSMLVAWHGDGMEVARHTLEGMVQVRVAVLILVLLAALGPLDVLPRQEGPAPDPDPTVRPVTTDLIRRTPAAPTVVPAVQGPFRGRRWPWVSSTRVERPRRPGPDKEQS